MRREDAHSIINYYKKICDEDPSIFSHKEWQANGGPREKLLEACRFANDPQLIQDGQEIMRRFDGTAIAQNHQNYSTNNY